MTNQARRPLEGPPLSAILHELALINAVAGGLKLSLDPLTDEDRALGAEPLTPEKIWRDLDRICDLVTKVAVVNLKADPSEWIGANDAIE